MSEALGTYLNDHLAGSRSAIDLVEAMQKQYAGEPLGAFAGELRERIREDQDFLRELAERVGDGSSALKEMAAWMAEKVSRLKLSHTDADGLGTFEALEFLALGIQGKLALWRALSAVSAFDERLQGADFEQLAARAESQHDDVEEWRMRFARTTFQVSPERVRQGQSD
jgi:hypothetical protein